MESKAKMSFWAAVLMSINIIIGAGIFAGPQRITELAGDVGFLIWPLVSLLMFPIVWGVVQASRVFPGEGGFYNYCSQGINKVMGFVAQWCYMLGYLATAAAITASLRNDMSARMSIDFIQQHPHLFDAVVVAIFTALNLLALGVISKLQNTITIFKLLPLFFIIGLLAWYWNPFAVTYGHAQFSGLRLAIPSALFAYWGFEACCSIGHLLEGGPRQVGKVALTAFGLVTVTYMFFHLSLIHIMGAGNLSAYGVLAFPDFMKLSTALTSLISTVIIGSIFLCYGGTIFGTSLANITNIFTLARQKVIIGGSALTKTNAWDRPTIAGLVYGIVLWLFLAMVTNKYVLMALANIGICSALTLTLVALLLHYLRKQNYLQVLVTLVGLGSASITFYYIWMTIGTSHWGRLIAVMPLLALLGVGLILYAIQQRMGASSRR
jgi:amino acid transporter